MRDPGCFEQRDAAGLEAVVATCEPGEPGRLPERHAGLLFQLEPKAARVPGELRVPLAVPVSYPKQTRVAAGGGSDGARRVLLRQRDVEAAQRKLARDG